MEEDIVGGAKVARCSTDLKSKIKNLDFRSKKTQILDFTENLLVMVLLYDGGGLVGSGDGAMSVGPVTSIT